MIHHDDPRRSTGPGRAARSLWWTAMRTAVAHIVRVVLRSLGIR